jgi:hypothetical protein
VHPIKAPPFPALLHHFAEPADQTRHAKAEHDRRQDNDVTERIHSALVQS